MWHSRLRKYKQSTGCFRTQALYESLGNLRVKIIKVYSASNAKLYFTELWPKSEMNSDETSDSNKIKCCLYGEIFEISLKQLQYII